MPRRSDRRGKKGQIASQVVVFILALVIGGMVLVFGYRAVQRIIIKSDLAAMQQFQSGMKSELESLSYGSRRLQRVKVPGNHLEICFADLHELRSNIPPPADTQAEELYTEEKYLVVNDSIYSGAESNVFLLPDGSESFSVGDLEIADGGLLCFELSAGAVEIGFEGKGNRTLVARP